MTELHGGVDPTTVWTALRVRGIRMRDPEVARAESTGAERWRCRTLVTAGVRRERVGGYGVRMRGRLGW